MNTELFWIYKTLILFVKSQEKNKISFSWIQHGVLDMRKETEGLAPGSSLTRSATEPNGCAYLRVRVGVCVCLCVYRL